MRLLRELRHHVTLRKVFLLPVLTVAILTPGFAYLAEATSPQDSADKGKTIYSQQCASCHSIGGGRLVGPDLKDITAKRPREWLVRFTEEPDKMIAEKDPVALALLKEYNNIPMPNMHLSEDDAEAVISYLESTATSASAPAAVAAQPAASASQPASAQMPAAVSAGDRAAGKALFSGAVPFKNGGSPCVACHEVSGIGALGGGTLGPDLTNVHGKYGDAGLASVLANSPFPTMQPVYGTKPLTPEEQANLRAFFQTSSGQPVAMPAGQLTLLMAGGFLLLMFGAHLVWRKRLRAVRVPLVQAASRARR